MAFEDRSSPNTATSPGSETGLLQVPNSPESSRTSPYTCTTIYKKNETITITSPQSPDSLLSPKTEPEKSIFRITSFALPSPKHERNSHSPSSYQIYSPKSPDDSEKSFNSTSEASNDQRIEEEPTIQTLKYSIRNILQPDFGKCAVQNTRTTPKITFKPYETVGRKKIIQAPLGSLCQTVSQIGKVNTTHEEINQRPESPDATLPSPEELKSEDGKVPTLWPAWVYCTRYSDRPSSGKHFFFFNSMKNCLNPSSVENEVIIKVSRAIIAWAFTFIDKRGRLFAPAAIYY